MKIFVAIICVSLLLAACKESPKEVESDVSDLLEASSEDLSLEMINQDILTHPESPNGYYKRAYYYKTIFDFENAISDINRALKLTPEVPALTYLKADILFNQAGATQNPLLYEQSEIYLLQTIVLDSTHVEAQVLEARINMSKPNFEKAMDNLDAALRADKFHAPAYFWKGMIFELLDQPDNAKSSYQTAVEIDANYYDALHHMANLLAKDLNQDALVYYDAALDVNPESFEVLRNKGLFLLQVDAYDEAKDCFDRILAFDPQNEECFFNIGNVYIASYRDTMSSYSKDTTTLKAIENFEKAVSLNDQYIDAYYNMGLVYEHRGDKQKAIENYQRTLVLEPMHKPAIEALKGM